MNTCRILLACRYSPLCRFEEEKKLQMKKTEELKFQKNPTLKPHNMMMTCCNCRFRISFTMQSRAVPITCITIHKTLWKKTIIIKHRLHYTRKHVVFFSFHENSIQMACIVHHMWLHVMQYAHCTQIISSLTTHIVLYEGVKTKKANLKCIVCVWYGIEENFSEFLLFERTVQGNVYVNRKGFTYCRHHYVLNAENSACEINEFAMYVIGFEIGISWCLKRNILLEALC